jgi:hypothetical protein
MRKIGGSYPLTQPLEQRDLTVTMTPRVAHLTIMLVRVGCYVAYWRHILRFHRKLGYWPDPAYPTRRNEKNPLFTTLSDKLLAKETALVTSPSLEAARVLWVGASVSEIPAKLLTGDVVVKANHGCGWNFFIRNGQFDPKDLCDKTTKWLRRTYGRHDAQWAYYDIKPRLFVEEFLPGSHSSGLSEYKIYASPHGVAFTFVRQPGPDGSMIEGVLDIDGACHADPYDHGTLSDRIVAPPEYRQMCAIAQTFARLCDFIRCDLYLIGGRILFSEFTFYPLAGHAWIANERLNDRYTKLWDLRDSWFMQTRQTGWRAYYAVSLITKMTDEPRK